MGATVFNYLPFSWGKARGRKGDKKHLQKRGKGGGGLKRTDGRTGKETGREERGAKKKLVSCLFLFLLLLLFLLHAA